MLESLNNFPLARFKFAEPLGQGAHAEVVKAYDLHLQRTVAVKLSFDVGLLEQVLDELPGDSELQADAQRLLSLMAQHDSRYTALREARLLALVDHPNVVNVLDIGLLEGHMLAVVMPYLDGGTLAERKFGRSWEETLDVALQIGWGLAALHDAGILHRDLKPNNILFGSDNRPRIADLGLACLTTDADALRERVGTAAYMAPDVVTRGFQDVRDDVYAYCMIVYEMFTGRSPFASAEAREHGRVSRPGLAMPREVYKLLERGLAADADERWPVIKPLLRKLERLRRAPKRWPYAVAAAGLVMSFIAGMTVDERVAEADECSEIMGELGPIWEPAVRGELQGAFGTRMAGDGLLAWANRWLVVRAGECSRAREHGTQLAASPCSASTRDRFQATLYAFRTPHLRAGLRFASVIAELPAPEYCIEHPEDADWGYGGLLELRNIDVEVDALVRLGDLDVARERQSDYMQRAMDHQSSYGTARALYFLAEIHRLEGLLADAEREFETALGDAVEIGANLFAAECLLKLTAVAGGREQFEAMDAYALMAEKLLERHQPDRVAELHQVHGLALVGGPQGERGRGVGLLLRAVEMRQDQYDRYGGTRELLSQAHESYANGLIAVGRGGEALEYLELALHVHQEEFGHGTWRVRGILRAKFSALLAMGRYDDASAIDRVLLRVSEEKADWRHYFEDTLWIAGGYAEGNQDHRAVLVLRAGLKMALEHERHEDVEMLEASLAELDL